MAISVGNDTVIRRVGSTVRNSAVFHKSKRAASNTARFSRKLLWSTGKAAWIAGTSFLVLIVPLIIEMDRDQQMVELESQQAGLLGATPSLGPAKWVSSPEQISLARGTLFFVTTDSHPSETLNSSSQVGVDSDKVAYSWTLMQLFVVYRELKLFGIVSACIVSARIVLTQPDAVLGWRVICLAFRNELSYPSDQIFLDAQCICMGWPTTSQACMIPHIASSIRTSILSLDWALKQVVYILMWCHSDVMW